MIDCIKNHRFLKMFTNALFPLLLLANVTFGETSETKKYNLSICAFFKNEAKYLKEWIEFHQLVGVDHFYLYDIESKDAYMPVLRPFIKKGIISLKRWPNLSGVKSNNPAAWAIGTQIPVYENAIKLTAANETKWLVFVDTDEFLIPPFATKLTDILEQYKDHCAVILTEDYFDASQNGQSLERRLMIETVERVKPPQKNLLRSMEKMIFKPDLCKGYYWPPYICRFKDEETAIKLDRKTIRINHYMNRGPRYLTSEKRKEIVRIADQPHSEEELNRLLDAGYEVEDPEKAMYRFVPEMLKKCMK